MSDKEKPFSNPSALGVTVLIALSYLLLLDITFETVRNRSSVRGWVAFVAAVYLAGSAVLWRRRRRLEWKQVAAITFWIILGLLTFTVWLPGGLINGLTALGLSTSILLSLVTLAAVVISGTILFQANYPHPAFRWGVAAVTFYGAAAFLLGIFARTPYPDLFRGDSFLAKLPWLVQGAFVGALVLTPAALLYQTVRNLRPDPHRESPWWSARFMKLLVIPVLAASVVMAIAGLTRDATAGYPILAQYTPKNPKAVIKEVSLSSSERNRFNPTKVSTDFVQGVRQIVLWYRWENALKGRWVEVRWSKDGSVVFEQEESIEEPSGSVSWFLARNQGEPLPPGKYQVELLENDELVTAIPFRIRGE